MRDGAELVFVEVRYRASARFGDGASTVTRSKQLKLTRAAREFLVRCRIPPDQVCRFDVISVSKQNYHPRFNWIANAFTTD